MSSPRHQKYSQQSSRSTYNSNSNYQSSRSSYNSNHPSPRFSSNFKPSSDDIRAVVAIDFGTTFSGFAHANKISPDEIEINTRWSGREGLPKTNTALLYDSSFKEVLKWGEPALLNEQKKCRNSSKEFQPQNYMIERFKLYLDDSNSEKPWLPENFDYRKAITDYLKKLKGVIEETLDKRWPGLRMSQVQFILCVPAEWGPHTKAIMRDCAYKAELLDASLYSHLEFTTEPEAAALHCISVIKEHRLREEDTFLVVDCGGGTVDLTMRTIQKGNRLKEETERTGDLCGSTFVDQEFIDFMGRVVGFTALQKFKTYAHGDLQRLVHRFFCQTVKLPFTGDLDKFEPIELDLERECPSLIQYITGSERTYLEENEWLIELDYDSVKKMFDPTIDKIIKVLKWTYGVEIKVNFDGLNDPIRLRTNDNSIWKFDALATRGTHVNVNQTFSKEYIPINADQKFAIFRIFITKERNPKYIKDAGMQLLGSLKVNLSKIPFRGRDRPVEFSLTFGTMEIKAMAKNKLTNDEYRVKFDYEIKK
ncbi:actin-like ATPase domain-containing protein [Gigaspora margarita]|uniref:Actin-like ATPase domain-containing protein n=1 Tax=Gigaspora margarita TaxID=4874 RepID=A0A8H4ARI7_GIGMA|nr:actin-like ATPase domain-containing protein [Gigaspora margarita]